MRQAGLEVWLTSPVSGAVHHADGALEVRFQRRLKAMLLDRKARSLPPKGSVPNKSPRSRAPSSVGMNRQGQRARAVLRDRGVHDHHVLAAIQTVPEHLFQLNRPDQAASDAASELPVPFTTLVALMVQALELQGDERVLDVGTGSGYQAALLGRLAREVYSVELDPGISEAAKRTLSKLGFSNVYVATGDASKGWPSAAPYQAIVVGAASAQVPDELLEQLDEGGRLVIAIGDENGQLVERLRKGRQALASEVVTWCTLPPLVFAQPRSPSSRPWMKTHHGS